MKVNQPNFDFDTKIQEALDLIKSLPEEPYVAFSGGKDSTVVYDLTLKARGKVEGHYCVSPIDPPELQRHIKQNFPDVQWDYHAKGFWKMVDSKSLPMRNARWCCQVIKEAGGLGRLVVTGVRRSEGANRSKRLPIEADYKRDKTYVRPILYWSDRDVWEYIERFSLPYSSLYDLRDEKGKRVFKRIGCVLCPFSRKIQREEQYFPKITRLWLLACNRLVEQRIARGQKTKKGKDLKHEFLTGQEMYDWWVKRK